MGTNIRIGGKTYRDVEAMNVTDLQKIVINLSQELRKLATTKVSSANQRLIKNQTEIIQKRIPLIERLINLKTSEENKDKP